MKEIWPPGWSTAGHYVPGMLSNHTLHISGQLPFNHQSGRIVEGGIAEQASMALKNVDEVLRAAGMTRSAVVACRVYIPDISLWDVVNAVYAAFFGTHKPARAIVPTGNLHHGALIEIEAVAEMEQLQ